MKEKLLHWLGLFGSMAAIIGLTVWNTGFFTFNTPVSNFPPQMSLLIGLINIGFIVVIVYCVQELRELHNPNPKENVPTRKIPMARK